MQLFYSCQSFESKTMLFLLQDSFSFCVFSFYISYFFLFSYLIGPVCFVERSLQAEEEDFYKKCAKPKVTAILGKSFHASILISKSVKIVRVLASCVTPNSKDMLSFANLFRLAYNKHK